MGGLFSRQVVENPILENMKDESWESPSTSSVSLSDKEDKDGSSVAPEHRTTSEKICGRSTM